MSCLAIPSLPTLCPGLTMVSPPSGAVMGTLNSYSQAGAVASGNIVGQVPNTATVEICSGTKNACGAEAEVAYESSNENRHFDVVGGIEVNEYLCEASCGEFMSARNASRAHSQACTNNQANATTVGAAPTCVTVSAANVAGCVNM